MRLALVSDIHGNTFALTAVLQDASARDVDLVVDLGDIASGGVDPAGTVAALRSCRLPIVHLRGNHERQLLCLAPSHLGASDSLAYDRLGAEDMTWLATLPATLSPAAGVLACHGTPDADTQYLLHTVTAEGLRDATDAEVLARLGDHASRHDVFVCGHTHLQGRRRLPGGQLVVNPGSVGWPAYDDDLPYPHVVEAGSPHARYTVLDRPDGGEAWTITPIALDYDHELAAPMATANGRPDVAHALRHGRVERTQSSSPSAGTKKEEL